MLAAGVLQEIRHNKLYQLQSLQLRLKQYVSEVPLGQEASDDADEAIANSHVEIVAATKICGEVVNAARVALSAGILVPIGTLLFSGLKNSLEPRNCEPEVNIFILLAFSFGWAPLVFAIYLVALEKVVSPIEIRLRKSLNAVISREVG